MAVNFNAGGSLIVAAQVLADTRQKESVKASSDGMAQAADVDNADDATPAALQQKLSDMADDMASVATQFRNRREFEKKGGAVEESFERVLDEDASPKAQKLVEVVMVQSLTLDSLLAQARSLFPDDSDLFLVLKELLKRKQLSQVQRKQLEGLLEAVIREADPKMLKGGINCALKARLFGKKLDLKASLLRHSYRRFLGSDRRPLEDYEEWIASYGHKARHIVLEFIEESLGIDIRAQDPSCDHLEFSYLLGHMRKLHLLRTADREFILSLLAKNLLPVSSVEDEKDEEAEWLLLFFALVKQKKDLVKLVTAMLALRLKDSQARSVWLNAVRRAYKRLPLALFQKPNDANGDDGAEFDTTIVLALFDKLIEQSYATETQEQRRSPT